MDEIIPLFTLPGKLEPVRIWTLEGSKRGSVPLPYWRPACTAVLASDKNVYAVSRSGPRAWRSSKGLGK